jgi:vacuolar-type H+-ATPase subunit H
MSLQAFGGSMLMNGLYSTADAKKPYVNFDLNLTDVAFTEIFKQVETLQKFAPIFEKASGKFSSKLSVNSLLQNNMMPNLASLIGNGSLSTKSIGLSNVEVINALASKLNRSGLSSSTIKDLALNFDIKDGKVNTKPFDVTLGNIKMKLGGSTGLDKTIAYTGTVQMPDQFNLGKFSNLNLKIGGTFAKPKVQVDMMSLLNTILSDTKSKAVGSVNKQIDAAKPNAIKAAQDQADQIRAEAKKVGDQLISEAKVQGDQLVAKASNSFTKMFAQKAAQKLLDEAQKKSDDLNEKADAKAKDLIQKASGNAKL